GIMNSTASLHGAKERWEGLPPQEVVEQGGRFGRMFDDIAPRRALLPKAAEEEQLQKLGQLMGGVVRERRKQVKKGEGRWGPKEKVIKEDVNDKIPAGFAFLAQFLAHDITYDPTSSLERQNDLPTLHNFRTPAFELDCLYGCGPVVSPHLYDQKREGRFWLDKGFDLPRNSQGTALIGDPRNDQNLILSQLHLAFLKFHNAVYDRINSIGDVKMDDQGKLVVEDRFERTQRLVRWYYQWIILREFLPLLGGSKMVCDILINGSKWYDPKKLGLFIPLEFSVAAYRFGHSQVHYLYRINDKIQFPIFSANPPSEERQDLRGG